MPRPGIVIVYLLALARGALADSQSASAAAPITPIHAAVNIILPCLAAVFLVAGVVLFFDLLRRDARKLRRLAASTDERRPQ